MYQKVKTLLQRRGLSYPPRVVQNVLLPKLTFNVAHNQQGEIGQVASKSLQRLLLAVQRPLSLAQLKRIVADWQRPNTDTKFTRWFDLPVADETRQAVDASAVNGPEHLIGQIDQDGRLYGCYGDLPGLEAITQSDFILRKKYTLDVLLVDDYVLVRKEFGAANEVSFFREAATLIRLQGQASVPTLYRVDTVNHQLYLNFMPHLTMRDVLAQAGVVIRDVDVQRDTLLQGLSLADRAHAVRERAAQAVASHFSAEFLLGLEKQLELIHAQGVVKLDIKVGNVIVAEGPSACLIDFENAQLFESTNSLAYQLKRDGDRERFNQAFSRTLLTDARARSILKAEQQKRPKWYPPIDFGYGLTVGGFWSTDTGTGRWEYLNKATLTPHLKGKRVLDLGSNVGIMPMLMLRDGAHQVVGLELETVNVERAQQVHKIFEWRDQCDYDFIIHNRNFHDIVSWDAGEFDVVTSLCSLYYLSESEMAAVVQRAAEIAPMMIIQANTSTEQVPAKRKKASVAFLRQLLEQAGFDKIELVAPPNFTRPILIGQRTVS